METINICGQFLSEVLNNRSASVQTQALPVFLKKFSSLIALTSSSLKIVIKPLGKKCLHCGKYVPKSRLQSCIGLWCNPGEHIMCSTECLQRHSLVCTNFSLLDLNYVTCPRCRCSIHIEQIKEAFGDKLEQIQSDACDRALNNLLDEEGKKQIESRFTCQICTQDFPVSEGLTLECDHRYCFTCMIEYTKGLIESAQVSEESLKCPMCPQPLTLYEIQEIVGPELYQKYEKFLLRGLKFGDDENSFMFYCPATDCEFFCIVDKNIEDIECAKCFHRCCPKCKQGPHPNMTCEQFKSVDKDDEIFKKMLREEGIINCPSCGAAVQRISGCEFMVCTSSQCQGKTYFCYECGIKLEHDHAPHPCDGRLAARLPVNLPVMRPVARPRLGLPQPLRKFFRRNKKK